jgi:hypothetical protein
MLPRRADCVAAVAITASRWSRRGRAPGIHGDGRLPAARCTRFGLLAGNARSERPRDEGTGLLRPGISAASVDCTRWRGARGPGRTRHPGCRRGGDSGRRRHRTCGRAGGRAVSGRVAEGNTVQQLPDPWLDPGGSGGGAARPRLPRSRSPPRAAWACWGWPLGVHVRSVTGPVAMRVWRLPAPGTRSWSRVG